MIINEMLNPSSPATAFLDGLAVAQATWVGVLARKAVKAHRRSTQAEIGAQEAVQEPLVALEPVGQR